MKKKKWHFAHFAMDGEKIIESLDSHWFFCSIFKPPPPPWSNSSNITPTHLKDSPHESKQPTPRIPIQQKQHNQCPNNMVGIETISKSDFSMTEYESSSEMDPRRRGKRSGESSSKSRGKIPWMKEIEEVRGFAELSFDIEEVGVGLGLKTISNSDISMAKYESSLEMEQRRISKRSGESGLKRRGTNPWMKEFEEVKGYMELGYDIEEVGLDAGWPMDGFEISRRRALHCKMPPFSDGIAMKEHLKSWAYAVACTVR